MEQRMTTAYDKHVFGVLATVVALLLMTLTGCDSPPDQAPAAGAAAPASAPAPQGGQMASIDANGNIAPFGFASRKPVPVAEAPAAAVATSAVSTVFAANCASCHGPDAMGVQGLGLNLVASRLVMDSAPDDLVVFLKNGRPLDAPDNVTGVPMPSFAWMNDADLAEVAAYLKSLNKG
jgi:disulfide bond formation protein DsbB